MKIQNNKKSTPSLAYSILLAVVLVGIGISSRLLMADWPNFNPALAIAIFMGYAIGNRWVGAAGLVLMMGISDAVIGSYDWQTMPLMLFVYGGFFISWVLGFAFRSLIDSPRFALKFGGVVAPALISSVAFFLITNFACCVVGWYPLTWEGLASALAAGLPFLRSTLASNVFFCTLLFSVYFAIQLSMKEQASSGPGRAVNAANDSQPASHS